jgi:peptidyl-prolyl cis-trans isomerase D
MPSRPTTKTKTLSKKHIARLERERRQTRIIVWSAAAVVVIVLGLIGYSLFNDKYLQPRQTVASVGEEKITTAQFQARVRLQRDQVINQYIQYSQFAQMFGMDFSSQLSQLESQLSASGAESLGQSVLDSMINEILLRNEAAKLGITASEEEINTRIQQVFDYYPDGTPIPTSTPTEVVLPTISAEQAAIVTITPTPTLEVTPLGTDTSTPLPTATVDPNATATATLDPSFTATATLEPTVTLAPTSTPTASMTSTPTQTATPGPTNTPEPTGTPYTREAYDTNFTTGMESFAKVGITEADYRKLIELDILRTKIMEYLTKDMKPVQEQVWARHILVADEATANQVRERLLKGEDFAVVAKEVSQDSTSATGGDLGWFAKGAMVAAFEEAAFSQKVGEIGKPVQTDFGWHIIQVIGHEDRPLTTDEFNQAKQTVFDNWLIDLRAKADEAGLIQTFDIWKDRVPLDPDLATALGQGQQ